MYLYKEPTSKDLQLKSHMVFSGTDDQSKGSEKIWKDHGFFGDQRADLTILKSQLSRELFGLCKPRSIVNSKKW